MTTWYLKACIHELLKFKFRAMWMYCVDPSFRAEINKLRSFISFKEYTTRRDAVPLHLLETSHRIIYPEWVHKLEMDLRQGKKIEPIHVMKIRHRYKVVDGHHRLAAIKQVGNFNKPYIPVLVREYQ